VKEGPDGYPYIVSGLKQSKTAKFGAVFRIVPAETTTTNTDDKLDLVKKQREETKSNIISTITNANTTVANTDLLSNQEDSPHNKTNTNVLLDIAPKPSNTTKTIDVKALDKLMQQK
jgi:hypothetical protein